MNKFIISAATIVTLSLSLLGCGRKRPGSPEFKDSLLGMLRNGTMGRQAVLFGVGNKVGPGSVWVTGRGDALTLRRLLSDAVGQGAEAEYMAQGTSFQGATETFFVKDLSGGVGINNRGFNFGIDLTRTKAVTVQLSCEKMTEVLLKGGLLEDLVNGKRGELSPEVKNFADDLAGDKRLVLSKAWQVEGFQVVITFDQTSNVDLGATAQNIVRGTDLKVGTASKEGYKGTIQISVPGSFFIAGEFSEVRKVRGLKRMGGGQAVVINAGGEATIRLPRPVTYEETNLIDLKRPAFVPVKPSLQLTTPGAKRN